jgi:hypothetical protein
MLINNMFSSKLDWKYSPMLGKVIIVVCSPMDKLELVNLTPWLVMELTKA